MKRCPCCSGSGKVLGGGMLTKDCDNCDGLGKLPEIEKPKVDKRSKDYRKSVSNLKEKYPNKDVKEIKQIMNEELSK